jgi:hypothetical protein
MKIDKNIKAFLSLYNKEVFSNALKLREVLLANLPGIIEQLDLPAKMVAYGYGQKYTELLCVIIPSNELFDPEKLLEGRGKISRYIVIESEEQINSRALKLLLSSALIAYQQRISIIK